jgi:hypothetical protein
MYIEKFRGWCRPLGKDLVKFAVKISAGYGFEVRISGEVDDIRVKFGVEGIDEMLLGGLLERSICAIVGNYAPGQTMFALQFAYEGSAGGEWDLHPPRLSGGPPPRHHSTAGVDARAFADRFYLLS